MKIRIEYFNLFTLEEKEIEEELDKNYTLSFTNNRVIDIINKKMPLDKVLYIKIDEQYFIIELTSDDWQKEIEIEGDKYILGYKKETNYIYFGRIT